LASVFVKMLSKEIYLKATKLSRKTASVREGPAKLVKLAAFVWSMCQYNLDVIKCSRHCVERLFARGIREIAVYGANDVAEVLYYLTLDIPVSICAVYDDFPGARFLDFEVLPIAACAVARPRVIVAALVGVDEKIERLTAAGTTTDRIVLLRHPGEP
jgi:hypothetical protein